MTEPASPLPDPPRYFPLIGGRYEVKPGLSRLHRPFGNGPADGHVFQCDHTFPRYRAAKQSARRERLGKYFQTRRFDAVAAGVVCGFVARRLAREHPTRFRLDGDALHCLLTGETLAFDKDFALLHAAGPAPADPPYACAFDALAAQVQEDLAVVCCERDDDAAAAATDRHDWLAAVHLCFPNAWAAEDKVGKDFAAVHDPVPGMADLNRRGPDLARLMTDSPESAAGLVRFAWGVTWDEELNHHPRPPPGQPRPMRFDPRNPRAFVRVERQTIVGFGQVGAALFTIRTYLLDCADIIRHRPAERDALAAALRTMPPESLAYKALGESRDDLLRWLLGGGVVQTP